ncbi:MAG: glycosyltransferase family 2 protein [Candidatus Heimdallarchaeota archaeon]|nr:glycosyltransferase family 2 protein [Candidatus Heimdallarchaeota archaeon]MCK4769977.1 glycosyltransferase family 2 protein [Candidatus Heimdallarchaeota archaeon]
MLSVIIPVYNEEENIKPLYSELKKVLQTLGQNFEIIFIDDGSTDNTLSELLFIFSKEQDNLRVIQLRRRFGKSAALAAGFDSVKGDIIITLDGDGQDNPNNIPLLLDALSNDIDVVCSWRQKRHGSLLFKKIPSKIYNVLNRLFNRLDIHDNDSTLRVYRKEAITELTLLGGDHRYIPAILYNKGFRFTEVKVIQRPRFSGKSKYGVKRIFAGLSDFFTLRFLFSYGQRPMRLFSKVGTLFLLTALGSGIYLLIVKFAYGQDIGTRPLLLLTILLGISGFQFLFTGFLAELIARKYVDSSSLYSIKKVHEIEEN